MEHLEKETALIPIQAQEITITDNPSFEAAGAFLKAIKGLRKKIDDSYDPIIKSSHSTWKEAIAQKKKFTDPLENSEACVKFKIGAYVHECESKRRLEEARLESELKARQEAEALEAAKHLEAQGETEAANEVMQAAIDTTPTVVLPKIQSKIEGISTRKVFKFKITDIKKIKPEFMIPDEKKIGAMVRATGKAAEGLIGGVAVYEEIITASRS